MIRKVGSWDYGKLQDVINDWWKTGGVFFIVKKETSEDEMRFILKKNIASKKSKQLLHSY